MKRVNHKTLHNINKHQGFTLVELMVTVIVMSLIFAISLPSYQEYKRRGLLTQTQQEMLKLAEIGRAHV